MPRSAHSRVACPRTENTFLQYALHGTAWYYDAEGMLVIKARLPAEAGQMFIQAIQAAPEDVSEPNVSAETPTVKFRPDPPARKAAGA